MGFYNDRIVPRLVNTMCAAKGFDPLRGRVCAGLRGEVIEIGFGSGLNMPFYPPEVTAISAVDPAELGWKLAEHRVRASGVPVNWTGTDGRSLPFPDARFDGAVSTFTMCTIPDVEEALGELRRVLKPGAHLHFVEHGLAPDERVRRLQRRMDPLQRRMFGGCHVIRPIADLLTSAGFTITDIDVFYAKGAPKYGGAFSLGVATA